MIGRNDGKFNKFYCDFVITSVNADGVIENLRDEQRDYLYYCLSLGHANGKSAILIESEQHNLQEVI